MDRRFLATTQTQTFEMLADLSELTLTASQVLFEVLDTPILLLELFGQDVQLGDELGAAFADVEVRLR